MATQKQKFATLVIEFAVAWLVAGASAAVVAYSMWNQTLPGLLVGLGFFTLSLWSAKRVDDDLFTCYANR